MWPWRRARASAAEHAERELRESQRRFWRAVRDAPLVEDRAAELARELPPGELMSRLARMLGTDPGQDHT